MRTNSGTSSSRQQAAGHCRWLPRSARVRAFLVCVPWFPLPRATGAANGRHSHSTLPFRINTIAVGSRRRRRPIDRLIVPKPKRTSRFPNPTFLANQPRRLHTRAHSAPRSARFSPSVHARRANARRHAGTQSIASAPSLNPTGRRCRRESHSFLPGPPKRKLPPARVFLAERDKRINRPTARRPLRRRRRRSVRRIEATNRVRRTFNARRSTLGARASF